VEIELRINGSAQLLDVAPQVSLLDALREYLGLTGTKKGCDQGACTVLADGRRINACLALAVQYEGREITTIEGVDHPLQAALVDSTGRRNTSILEVLMGRPAGWMKALTGRAPMKSPGKPSLRRDVERLFWREIAKGHRPVAMGSRRARGRRSRTQHQTPQNPRLEDTSRSPQRASTIGPGSRCCDDRLSPGRLPASE
jgi:hypothetical protein